MLYEGPLRPGVFRELMAQLTAIVEASTAVAVAECAKQVRDDARASFIGQHNLNEPSPARRGGPPSRISHTLDDSLTFTMPLRQAEGWVSHIGATPGMYPYYSSRTDSATYGFYLESPGAGRSHRRYPFLVPALMRFDESRAFEVFRAQRWL